MKKSDFCALALFATHAVNGRGRFSHVLHQSTTHKAPALYIGIGRLYLTTPLYNYCTLIVIILFIRLCSCTKFTR